MFYKVVEFILGLFGSFFINEILGEIFINMVLDCEKEFFFWLKIFVIDVGIFVLLVEEIVEIIVKDMNDNYLEF